ncbi:response regulator transcription factor [Parapedobacter deserti]|uniref:Response regulator transcription factor n=1 Tax=Parapedobacter deserti TaxID=1912957 RepID=A0ABV7JNS4_9SPHI
MENKLINPQKINLLLVDDHQLFVDGLRSILENHPRFTVWRTARDGREASSFCNTTNLMSLSWT